jgi:hypothetical protein
MWRKTDHPGRRLGNILSARGHRAAIDGVRSCRVDTELVRAEFSASDKTGLKIGDPYRCSHEVGAQIKAEPRDERLRGAVSRRRPG